MVDNRIDLMAPGLQQVDAEAPNRKGKQPKTNSRDCDAGQQGRPKSEARIANHAWYTFWYVVPTLPMFLAFPGLLPRLGFWPTLLACIAVTTICFWLFALAVRRFGIELL